MLGSVTHLGDQPRVEQLIGVIKVMLDAYTGGQVDKVFLAYNDSVNTMTQRAAFDQLLPLPPSDDAVARPHWDYSYDPAAPALLTPVSTRPPASLGYPNGSTAG